MTTFFFAVLLTSVGAGTVGAVLGLGGGILLVPILTRVLARESGLSREDFLARMNHKAIELGMTTLRQDGLRTIYDGETTIAIPVRVAETTAEIAPQDFVIVAVKGPAMASVAPVVVPAFKPTV